MDRTPRQKMNKKVKDLNAINLIEVMEQVTQQ